MWQELLSKFRNADGVAIESGDRGEKPPGLTNKSVAPRLLPQLSFSET
jgi:hypothetical protein